MRRLCDSWTKRDDDKAETSRMGDDDDEIVKVNDGDKVDMIESQVNSSGNKPWVRYTGAAYSTRSHMNLEEELDEREGVVFKKTKMPFLVVLPHYIHL